MVEIWILYYLNLNSFWGDTYFEIYYPISCLRTQSFQDISYQFPFALHSHHQHQFYGTVFQMVMLWKAAFAISLTCLPAFLCSEGPPSCSRRGGLWLCLHSPLTLLLKEVDVPLACSLHRWHTQRQETYLDLLESFFWAWDIADIGGYENTGLWSLKLYFLCLPHC